MFRGQYEDYWVKGQYECSYAENHLIMVFPLMLATSTGGCKHKALIWLYVDGTFNTQINPYKMMPLCTATIV